MSCTVTRGVNTMIDLLLLPALVGILVALVAGPLGSFTVWRGMAYLGDTLAHSALLGVAAALMFHWNIQIGILFCCIVIALLLLALQSNTRMSSDSLLGILSHSSLALGLVVVSVLPSQRVDLYAYLFGDLLMVNLQDVFVIAALVLLSLGLLIFFWRKLLMISIDEELAQAEGLNVRALKIVLIILLATVIAVAMKTVGILLITALLIIPAAAAQQLTRSPEAMALFASFCGILCVIGGLLASAWLDTPTGPSIVLCAAMLFSGAFILKSLARNKNKF